MSQRGPRDEHRALRHRRRAGQVAPREQLVSIDQALNELVAVRREMSELPPGLTKYQREARLIEPMSRLALVCRFLDEILTRNGWGRSVSA